VLGKDLGAIHGDVEDTQSLHKRERLIHEHPIETLGAVLNNVITALGVAVEMMHHERGASGGPSPLIERQFLIIRLAKAWVNLGKPVSTGPQSDFVSFVVGVVDAIGWPSDLDTESGEALTSAIRRAIDDWRNMTKNKVE
jgi:hypothetical protein